MDTFRIEDVKLKCLYLKAAHEQREHIFISCDKRKEIALDSLCSSVFYFDSFISRTGALYAQKLEN